MRKLSELGESSAVHWFGGGLRTSPSQRTLPLSKCPQTDHLFARSRSTPNDPSSLLVTTDPNQVCVFVSHASSSGCENTGRNPHYITTARRRMSRNMDQDSSTTATKNVRKDGRSWLLEKRLCTVVRSLIGRPCLGKKIRGRADQEGMAQSGDMEVSLSAPKTMDYPHRPTWTISRWSGKLTISDARGKV